MKNGIKKSNNAVKKVVDPLKKAEYNINVAFVVSLITILLSLILYFVDLGNGQSVYGIMFIDIIFFAVFSFGIYKKSRVAAISAFVYFVIGKIVQIVGGMSLGSIVIWGSLFGIAYFKGIQGTFSYHKIMKTKKINGREIALAIVSGVIILLALIGLFSY